MNTVKKRIGMLAIRIVSISSCVLAMAVPSNAANVSFNFTGSVSDVQGGGLYLRRFWP